MHICVWIVFDPNRIVRGLIKDIKNCSLYPKYLITIWLITAINFPKFHNPFYSQYKVGLFLEGICWFRPRSELRSVGVNAQMKSVKAPVCVTPVYFPINLYKRPPKRWYNFRNYYFSSVIYCILFNKIFLLIYFVIKSFNFNVTINVKNRP